MTPPGHPALDGEIPRRISSVAMHPSAQPGALRWAEAFVVSWTGWPQIDATRGSALVGTSMTGQRSDQSVSACQRSSPTSPSSASKPLRSRQRKSAVRPAGTSRRHTVPSSLAPQRRARNLEQELLRIDPGCRLAVRHALSSRSLATGVWLRRKRAGFGLHRSDRFALEGRRQSDGELRPRVSSRD